MEKYSNHFTKLIIEVQSAFATFSLSPEWFTARYFPWNPLLAEAAHDEAMRWFYFPPFRKVRPTGRGCRTGGGGLSRALIF